MTITRLTKRTVDLAEPRASRYVIFDDRLKGFGLRVFPSGEKSWIVEYRPGHGSRATGKRRFTIGSVAAHTPEEARKQAKDVLSAAHLGDDPVKDKTAARHRMTVAHLVDLFLTEHVEPKRKAGTIQHYRALLTDVVMPVLGSLKVEDVTRADIAKLHLSRKATPYQANRILAVLGSMFHFAQSRSILPDGFNPARRIGKFTEHRRERFLSTEELEKLGDACREAETVGIAWEVDEGQAKAKHIPKKPENRRTILSVHATAAIRLLILTGARLREILHLRWDECDFERGLLLLADSKTGKKTIVLNAAALAVIANLPRLGDFVIAGNDPKKPRADLQKPWALISKRAGLSGVRLHDLRHTYASFGAGSGLGLPIIGKLLGHTQAATTQRYAHLDSDPLRRASDAIGAQIGRAIGTKVSPQSDIVTASLSTRLRPRLRPKLQRLHKIEPIKPLAKA